MLKFFRNESTAESVEALHDAVVAGARRPDLYARLGVPDTPWGRVESVMLHALLVVRQLGGLPPPAADLAQGLVDRMFADFDRALRQIGVGDLSVPKKMKALGGDWLGRIAAYSGPLDRADERALADALARNVLSRDGEGDAALPLARQALACAAALAHISLETLQAGELEWPPIEEDKQ